MATKRTPTDRAYSRLGFQNLIYALCDFPTTPEKTIDDFNRFKREEETDEFSSDPELDDDIEPF
jgi:hypothetical protein